MSHVTIRHGRQEDLDALVALGLAFHAASPYRDRVPVAPEKMRALGEWLLGHGAIFVADDEGTAVGMLGVAVMPHMMSGILYASECFWWVTPAARGSTGLRLLREAEAWAQARGARFMQLVAPDARAERLYERLGYEAIERSYQRDL